MAYLQVPRHNKVHTYLTFSGRLTARDMARAGRGQKSEAGNPRKGEMPN